MALAQSALTNINGWIAALFYVVAGLGWVLPAMPLISWMARPDKAKRVVQSLCKTPRVRDRQRSRATSGE